jgi:hypothetical protein
MYGHSTGITDVLLRSGHAIIKIIKGAVQVGTMLHVDRCRLCSKQIWPSSFNSIRHTLQWLEEASEPIHH